MIKISIDIIRTLTRSFPRSVLSKEDLDKLSWDTVVMERSYHVTGAHMCRAVEEKAGKEVFKRTLLDSKGLL